MSDTNPQQATLDKIAEAAAKYGDNFAMRIMRKDGRASLPDVWARFLGARAEHFAAFEMWLPSLCEADCGGYFDLVPLHFAVSNSTPLGAPIEVYLQGTKNLPPRRAALTEPDWTGPTEMVFPKPRAEPATPQGIAAFSALPPVAGPFVPAPAVTPAATPAPVVPLPGESLEMARLRTELAAARQTEIENRHRADLAALRAEFAVAQNAVAAKLDAVLNRPLPAPAAPPPAPSFDVEKLITVASPVVLGLFGWLQSNSEKQEQRRRDEQAEERRRQDERDREMREERRRFEERIEAANAKVAGQGVAQLDMEDRRLDMISKTTNLMIQTATAAAELQQPQGDSTPTVVLALREGARILGGLTAMQENTIAMANLRAKGLIPALPQQPAPNTTTPPVAPSRAPAPAPADPNTVVLDPRADPIDNIRILFNRHHDVIETAAYIVDRYVGDPRLQARVKAANEDIGALFNAEFGAWMQASKENDDYITRLAPVLMEKIDKLRAAQAMAPNPIMDPNPPAPIPPGAVPAPSPNMPAATEVVASKPAEVLSFPDGRRQPMDIDEEGDDAAP